MKRIAGILIILLTFSCSGGKNQQEKSAEKTTSDEKTTVAFDQEVYDFGTLKAGEIVVCTFTFTNTGNTDYLIDSIDTECGCISVQFPREAVKPGQTGNIEIEFDSSGMVGREYKAIEIKGNSKELKHLAIFAIVENELLKIKY
ncbi:DUF1573 domain-containing protein [Maribellus sp. YY47]|uniref:DUF1573 domain-containing protein n=1 Tax=Maribellus sp. YY47 TaxID=2929486 RepID=UPI0020005D63|nr:DUF1573 domain-containing protein [Maribellus sp. YY47]MCK3683293.1 DUF1573 domain-containing protein [Maribellus sp. YY47]